MLNALRHRYVAFCERQLASMTPIERSDAEAFDDWFVRRGGWRVPIAPVAAYLEILKRRLGPRLELGFDVERDARHARVPPGMPITLSLPAVSRDDAASVTPADQPTR